MLPAETVGFVGFTQKKKDLTAELFVGSDREIERKGCRKKDTETS